MCLPCSLPCHLQCRPHPIWGQCGIRNRISGLRDQTRRGLEGQTEVPGLCPLGHGEPGGGGYRGRRGQKMGAWSHVHMESGKARVRMEEGPCEVAEGHLISVCPEVLPTSDPPPGSCRGTHHHPPFLPARMVGTCSGPAAVRNEEERAREGPSWPGSR